MLSQDQTNDEGVAGLWATFKANTNTVISHLDLPTFRCSSLLTKCRGLRSHTARRREGRRHHLDLDTQCPWVYTSKNVPDTAHMGNDTPGSFQKLLAFTSVTDTNVLVMVWVHGASHVTQRRGLQKTTGHIGEQRKLTLQVYCRLWPVDGSMLITPDSRDKKCTTGDTQSWKVQERRPAFLYWMECSIKKIWTCEERGMACKWGRKREILEGAWENLLLSVNKLSYVFVESKPGGKNPTSGYLHILYMKTWSDKIQCLLVHVILKYRKSF